MNTDVHPGARIGPTIGAIAVDVPTVDGTITAGELNRLFHAEPDLPSVVVRLSTGTGVLTRDSFAASLVGRIGYGHALHWRRPIAPLADADPLVVDDDLDLGAAARGAAARPADRRDCDLLVRRRDGSLGVVTMARLFERLAEDHGRRATTDALTGLGNRASVQERLDAIACSDRSAALLYCDLDRFKAVNDSAGHAVGDELLRSVARRFTTVVPTDALLARVGGDEFVVIVEGMSRADGEALAQSLAAALVSPFRIAGRSIGIDASVGIAWGTSDLLLRADRAMYRAKAAAGCSVALDDAPVDVGDDDPLAFEHDLRLALAATGIDVVFQPIVDLPTGRIVAAEALARWERAGRNVPPSTFVPSIERLGLAARLGDIVLGRALAQLVEWDRELGDDGPDSVAVNLSPSELVDPSLVDRVAAALGRHGVAAGRLWFEITETAALLDTASSAAAAHSLRDLGVHLALDDFGTRFSSLDHLRVLPVDGLKVDRSLTADLRHDPSNRGRAIARAVIRLSDELGLTVTVEGIEDAEDLDAVLAIGCPRGQGWHLGRPAAGHRLRPAGRALAVS